MKPHSSKSIKEIIKQQDETKEEKSISVNAKKSLKIVNQRYPNEQWIHIDNRIYLSPNRPIGKKSNYKDELRDAQILRNIGSTIYLVPEKRSSLEKKFDAIVNGLQFEFKNISGNENTLQTQFLRSRSQAPNVFINLETSKMTKRQIISALFGARNRHETAKTHGYSYYNKFKGGIIILKIKGHDKLLYLKVDDLKLYR